MIGFGILQGPNVSIESKIFKFIGLSASYGTFSNLDLFRVSAIKQSLNQKSQDYQIDSLGMNYTQYEAKLSIYPFGGTFFIAAAYGKRNITLNSNGNINITVPSTTTRISTPFTEEIKISSTYWTPQIGWLATWGGSFGWFAIGTELGVQITLQSSVDLTPTFTNPTLQPLLPVVLASPEYTSMNDQLKTGITDALKEYPLPYWNILKIGWMF